MSPNQDIPEGGTLVMLQPCEEQQQPWCAKQTSVHLCSVSANNNTAAVVGMHCHCTAHDTPTAADNNQVPCRRRLSRFRHGCVPRITDLR